MTKTGTSNVSRPKSIGIVLVASSLATAILFSFPLVAQTTRWKGSIMKEGKVTVVRNPKEPIYKDPVMTLKEDWVIGGEKAQGEYAIARPYSLAVDKAGNVFVLDSKESHIQVFDQTGKFLQTIGRRGQGPGEIGGAFNMVLAPGSDDLVIIDIGNRRLSFFSVDGSVRKSIPLLGLVTDAKVDSQGNIYILDTDLRARPPRETLKKMSPDLSKVLIEIISHPQDESRNPFKARDIFIIDDQDRLIYGDAKKYEIKYFAAGGELVRKIVRDHEPLKVTQEDIDEFRNRPTPPGISPSYDYSSHHAAFRSFFIDDLGHLFVQTWERTADNRQDIHDIFDAEGRFVGRVALPQHADLINPKVRLMIKGKFYAIEPDAKGYEVVKRYSVAWMMK